MIFFFINTDWRARTEVSMLNWTKFISYIETVKPYIEEHLELDLKG